MPAKKQVIRQSAEHEFDSVRRIILALNLPPGLSPEVAQANIDKINQSTIVNLLHCRDKQVAQESIEDVINSSDNVFDPMIRTDGKKYFYRREGQEWGERFDYNEAERDWVINELCVCAASFEYWYWRYFFIKHVDGAIARPNPTIAHRMIMDIIADYNRRNLPVLMLFLKARQLGVSTFHIGVILWLCIFHRGYHTILASAEEGKSIELCGKIWLAIEKLPLWMQLQLTREDISKGPEWGEIKSDISIQHGSMKKGMSRGDTPQAGLVSEASWYPDPVNTIESSLMRAMHENPRTYLILETTARKKDDWFHRTWKKNREGESTGYNRFICVFLPWYVGRDIYPTKDWVLNHPVPANWTPLKDTIKQAEDAKLYVRTTPMLKKFMGEKWEMDREQMWYWEFQFVDASRSDESLKSFRAEMASDERSAFQSKRWSVFNDEVLDGIEKKLSTKFVDYAIMGDGISEKFHLREFQSQSARRVEVNWCNIKGEFRSWRLVPLARTPEEENLQMFIRVWELPKPGYQYTIAIDVSGGIGQDATVFEIMRKGKHPGDPDVEVAQLWSPWISSAEAPPFALCLGLLYGRHMSPRPEALMCPETQISVGDPISFQLAQEGYTNFHYFDRMDTRKPKGSNSNRRGWATVAWSRPMMMEALKHGIENFWVHINSESTLSDLQNLEAEELDSGKTKYEHAEGEHDDCYISLAIAYFCSHNEETMTERMRGNIRPKPFEEETPPEVEDDQIEAMLARRFRREEAEDFPTSEQDGSINVF